MAPDFCSSTRRVNRRVVELLNCLRNKEDGQKDKPDAQLISWTFLSNRKLTTVNGHDESLIFYYSPEFYQRLDLLKHLTRNSSQMLLVSGPEGVGKSTLLDQFEANAEQEWMLCRIAATPMLQPDQLLIQLVHCFGASDADENMESALLRRFHNLQAAERLPVMMIDDAHQLPPATLALLYRLHLKGEEEGVRTGMLLFALPEITRLLQAELLDVQQLQCLDLLPLDSQQTALMADRLIRIQGLSDTIHLSGSQLGKVYRFSGGLPGEIRRLVQDLMSEGDLSGRKSQAHGSGLFSDLPLTVLVSGALLAVLIGLTLIYQDEINRLFEEKTPDGELPVIDIGHEAVVPLLLPEPDEKPSQKTDGVSTRTQLLSQQAGLFSNPKADPDAERVGAEIPEAEGEDRPTVLSPSPGSSPLDSESSPHEATGTDPAAPVVTEARPDPIPPATAPIEGKTEKSQAKKATEPAVQPEPPVKHLMQKRPPPVGPIVEADTEQPATLSAAEKLTAKQATEPAVQLAPSTEPHQQKRPPPVPVKKSGMRREAWLLGQEPGAYTLQLIGLGDEKAVARFIERHRLSSDVAYFRSYRDGAPWYSVLYGLYPNRDAAVAARATLPAKVGRGVWPRTLGSVQQAIREK